MALTPYSGSTPQRNVRATFSTYMDAFITWFLGTFMAEIDAVVVAQNFNSTNSVSTTSDTIATGATTITVEASKSYVIGMTVKIASTATGTDWMLGEVTGYDSGTGVLDVSVRVINGSGTVAAWTVSHAGPFLAVQDTSLILHTGNGHGSTSTAIRRFTTSSQTGNGIATYADSSTLGAVITIAEAGVYAMDYMEEANSATYFGISLNSTQLTTQINSITVLDRLTLQLTLNTTTSSAACSVVMYLNTGDVIRPHTTGTAGFGTTSGMSKFTIRKVFEYV